MGTAGSVVTWAGRIPERKTLKTKKGKSFKQEFIRWLGKAMKSIRHLIQTGNNPVDLKESKMNLPEVLLDWGLGSSCPLTRK